MGWLKMSIGKTKAPPIPTNGASTQPPPPEVSLLTLLQSFLKAQQTRTAISHELVSSFQEPNITDEALDKVIHISSVGLLEVKSEIGSIVQTLATSFPLEQECQDNIRQVERMEKERIEGVVKELQMKRILALKEKESSNGSVAFSADDTRRELRSAIEESERKTSNLASDINDVLEEVRSAVAYLADREDEQ